MLQVTTSQDSGYTVYTFEANNTEYEVLTDDSELFTVYSKRKSLSSRATPKVYTLSELAKRSKVLRGFAALISGDNSTVN